MILYTYTHGPQGLCPLFPVTLRYSLYRPIVCYQICFIFLNMDGCEYIIIYIHLFIFMTWSRFRLCVQQQCRVADEESGSVLTVLVPQRAASPQPTI